MAMATEQLRDFLAHVKRVNPAFTRSRSSLELLLDHLDAELKKSKNPPAFKGADQRERFDTAVALCRKAKDPRLHKYHRALWCLARVWGSGAEYPLKDGQVLRVLHVALLKYNTQTHQADAIDTRKLLLEEVLGEVETLTADYISPSTRALQGTLLAPEYLFAKPSPHAGHEVGDTRHLYEGAKCSIEGWLAQLSGRHAHWLLFPGTIAWKKALTRDRETYIRRHGRAHPELSAEELGKRFDAKNATRTDKALASIQHFGETFKVGPTQGLSGDMTEYDDVQTFPPSPDLWAATDSVTPKREVSKKTGRQEYWTQDAKLARARLIHAAPTNQQKVDALKGGARRMARNTCIAMFGGRRVLKYHKMNDYHEVLDDPSKVVYVPGERLPVCTVDGIRFSLEVCLDHAMETTKQLVANHKITTLPDFLALLSAAVEFKKDKLPLGIPCVAHCSSVPAYNMLESTKANAVVLERDDPRYLLYSLVISP